MAHRVPRRETRSIGHEIADITRGLIHAEIEGIASAADVARRFWDHLQEDEALHESETEAEVIRRAPRAVQSASRSITTDILEIPKRAVDTFYDEYYAPRESRRSTSSGREFSSPRRRRTAPRSAVIGPEREIFQETEWYLNRMPSRAATLKSVVDHVVLVTDYDESTVRSLLLRNFVSSGRLIRDQIRSTSIPLRDEVEARMHDALRDLGYSDIRYNVALHGLNDLDDEASLVAYEGDFPTVLCYPVNEGVGDPIIREAARFQALAIEREKSARYVWVSDGHRDYFLDAERDVAISSLPRAGSSDVAKNSSAE